jgi:hypothetical protein
MSCLFNSLSRFIPENSFDIRQKICNYLEENKPIIDGIETKDILSMESKHYIQNMRNTSTWGGAIEIQAACNIWNMSINVHNIRGGESGKINFVPITSTSLKTINITWNGGHYEPHNI